MICQAVNICSDHAGFGMNIKIKIFRWIYPISSHTQIGLHQIRDVGSQSAHYKEERNTGQNLCVEVPKLKMNAWQVLLLWQTATNKLKQENASLLCFLSYSGARGVTKILSKDINRVRHGHMLTCLQRQCCVLNF